MRLIDAFVKGLSSLWLCVTLLVLLALLTWLGTLEQVHTGLFEVQKKYFESIFFIHHAGPVPIPLPGATLVLGVLFVNIILGGIVRLRKRTGTIGVLITHVGIAFLVISAFVKAYFAEEGHLTLYEGQRSNVFESYHNWEIAVLEKLPDGQLREVVAPEKAFTDAEDGARVVLTSKDLPFSLEVTRYLSNSRVLPKGPMFDAPLPVVDGFFLEREEKAKENEQNVAGAYVAVLDPQSTGRKEAILWGAATQPWTIEVGGKTYGVELRRSQYLLPFTLRMDDFVKEDHPRMTMAKSFSSDVTVFEGSTSRPTKIEMNEPLRSQGLVLYQSSWGPSNARPGDRLFSTLSVVRNPADQYPLWACIVIAVGLLWHFGLKLFRHIRSEARGIA
ncbi:MAG: cytochrome c biogenesis protein ResB [Planctomycetes bacterium]|jgi:cytochrome c biogenesis protein ResB|nr:cytochrome c biogenesis protein ResB [Planctomycetota bacterium]